jgi:hypothetical protein
MDPVPKFDDFEKNKQWSEAYKLIPDLLTSDSESPDNWIRILYFLHNLVLESLPITNTDLDSAKIEKELLEYFGEANKRFASNAQYLFFMGIIGHIAEWYWGEANENFAFSMSKKVFQLEPNNRLYEWGSLDVDRSEVDKKRAATLAKFLYDDPLVRDWLLKRGFPGRYVLEIQLKGAARSQG